MKKNTYSTEIANVVKQFLTEDKWYFDFNEEYGVFDFGLRLRCKLQKIHFFVGIKDDEMVVYAVSPISADHNDPQMMAQMVEFVCYANYGLMNGNFEFDYRDGEIRYKSYIDCTGKLPSTEVVKNSIHFCAAMFERYGAGITGIIFADMTAKEAVEMCDSQDKLHQMVADWKADEDANADDSLARMVEQLAEIYPDAAANVT